MRGENNNWEYRKLIKIVSWNIGGAKYLSGKDSERDQYKNKLNNSLKRLAEDFDPDFIVLQEIVKYGDPALPEDPITPPSGYFYDASVAIDTKNQSHPTKWRKYYNEKKWPPKTYLAQGYGILWRKDIPHSSIWDFSENTENRIEKEIIRIDTGIFTGNRNSEPRLAVVTHFIKTVNEKPIDIFIINLHLTTLNGEREGYPNQDSLGIEIRHQQIDIVLNGIVSRYNEWAAKEYCEVSRPPAIWVLAGDFNCVPSSSEIKKIKRMNFIDLNPNKGSGTKGKGFPVSKATITLDYIFAGPAYFAIDPYLIKQDIEANPLPLYQFKASDHFPIFANLPINV